jgi:cell division protein FtsB
MTPKQNILLSISILLLIAFFFFIIISEHGYSDLTDLKREQIKLIQENNQLSRENIAISIEIDRLKNDHVYIENIARRELGMIAKDEIILKPQDRPDRKK